MQKLVIDLNGVQNLVDLTDDEIAEFQQLAIVPKSPRRIDKRRLRMALYRLGLLDSLMFAIDAVGVEATMQWEDTTIFSEESQLVQALIQGLGWDSVVVDSIFETAGAIV